MTIAVLGAGAMGTALALRLARDGADVDLLATDHDGAALAAWAAGAPHPVLGVPFSGLRCQPDGAWGDVLRDAQTVLVAISSAGLAQALDATGASGACPAGGVTVAQALTAIGSTVERVAATGAALRLAQRHGLELPSARIVERALQHDLAGDLSVPRLREMFHSALTADGAVPVSSPPGSS